MQQANSSIPETLVTIPARFDGNQIKLDVPYYLPPNAPLLVVVLQPKAIQESPTRERFTKLLALRGVLANDNKYDEVLRKMDEMWQSWKLESA